MTTKEDLLQQWDPLIKRAIGHYIGQARMAGLTRDDLYQEGWIGLNRAQETHDPVKGKSLASWAYVYIYGYMSHAVRMWGTRRGTRPIPTHISALESNLPGGGTGRLDGDWVPVASPSDTELDYENREFLAWLLSSWADANEKDREACALYFLEGKNYREIGEEMGVTHQMAHLRVKRARKVMEEKAREEGLV